MSDEIKPLTQAQQKRLRALNEAAIRATQAVNDFIEYLREEHGCPVGEWEITDIARGFEKVRSGQDTVLEQ